MQWASVLREVGVAEDRMSLRQEGSMAPYTSPCFPVGWIPWDLVDAGEQ